MAALLRGGSPWWLNGCVEAVAVLSAGAAGQLVGLASIEQQLPGHRPRTRSGCVGPGTSWRRCTARWICAVRICDRWICAVYIHTVFITTPSVAETMSTLDEVTPRSVRGPL